MWNLLHICCIKYNMNGFLEGRLSTTREIIIHIILILCQDLSSVPYLASKISYACDTLTSFSSMKIPKTDKMGKWPNQMVK